MADLSFEDAVRVLSTAEPELPRGAITLDSAVLTNPVLRIDAWASILRNSTSNTSNKYARKVVIVLARTLAVGLPSWLAAPGVDAELLAHVREWLWTVCAVLVSSTSTSSGSPDGVLVGMGASMFGRVDEVVLLVGPALRLYAAASPATLATMRTEGKGCPLTGLACVCTGLLARYSLLPAAQRKIFDSCFGADRGRDGENGLYAALCGARAAAIEDVSRVRASVVAASDKAGGCLSTVQQAARLLELVETSLTQVTESCCCRRMGNRCDSLVSFLAGAF